MAYAATGDDTVAAGTPSVTLNDTKKKTADWNELAAKISVFVGLLTLYTMAQSTWRKKR